MIVANRVKVALGHVSLEALLLERGSSKNKRTVTHTDRHKHRNRERDHKHTETHTHTKTPTRPDTHTNADTDTQIPEYTFELSKSCSCTRQLRRIRARFWKIPLSELKAGLPCMTFHFTLKGTPLVLKAANRAGPTARAVL